MQAARRIDFQTSDLLEKLFTIIGYNSEPQFLNFTENLKIWYEDEQEFLEDFFKLVKEEFTK